MKFFKGEGVQYDYGFRIYDSRMARFLSVDPLTSSYPMLTPYQFASNSPIAAIDLDGLALGAFGGMHQHPHGWPAVTTDITAACLHTLCEIHAHVVKPEGSGLRVNFHCDYDGKDIAIRARSGSVRRLVIRYRKPAALKIRIPAWAPRASVSVRAVNVRVVTRWEGTGVWIAAVNPAEPLFVEYDLPVVETAECIDGVSYKVRWHGDEIHGIAPNAEFLPFYPNLGVSTQSCATDATAKA